MLRDGKEASELARGTAGASKTRGGERAQQVVLRGLNCIPGEKRQHRPLEAEREPALVSGLRGDGAGQTGSGVQSRGRSEARLRRR